MKTSRWVVPHAEHHMSLLDFLTHRLKLSRNKAKRILDERLTFVNRRRTWMAHHRLRENDVVEVSLPDPAPEAPSPCRVIFEDSDYIAVHKPPGILSNGKDSLESRLRTEKKLETIQAVHRLDRDTSGCLLYAKSPEAMELAVACFRQRQVTKIYHAIVAGKLDVEQKIIRTPIENQPAITHIRTIRAGAQASHLWIRIETGRTHQIRKHLLQIRHPILGDQSYGAGNPASVLERKISRQMLHAARMEFQHPRTHTHLVINAPLPRDFRACLKMFGVA